MKRLIASALVSIAVVQLLLPLEAWATDGTNGMCDYAPLDCDTGQVFDSQVPPTTIVQGAQTATLTAHGTVTLTSVATHTHSGVIPWPGSGAPPGGFIRSTDGATTSYSEPSLTTNQFCPFVGTDTVTETVTNTTTASDTATGTGFSVGAAQTTAALSATATGTHAGTSTYTFTTTDTGTLTASGVLCNNTFTATYTASSTATAAVPGTVTGTTTTSSTGTTTLSGTATAPGTATLTSSGTASKTQNTTCTQTQNNGTGLGVPHTGTMTTSHTGTITFTGSDTKTVTSYATAAQTGTASGVYTTSTTSTATQTAHNTLTRVDVNTNPTLACQPITISGGGVLACGNTCTAGYTAEIVNGSGLVTNGPCYDTGISYVCSLPLTVSGNITADGGVVVGTNINASGDTTGAAAGSLRKGSACASGYCVTQTNSGGDTSCVPCAGGSGISCSGTCSASNLAKFSDGTHVTNGPTASATPGAGVAALGDGSGTLNSWVNGRMVNWIMQASTGGTSFTSGSGETTLVSYSYLYWPTGRIVVAGDATLYMSSTSTAGDLCKVYLKVDGSMVGIDVMGQTTITNGRVPYSVHGAADLTSGSHTVTLVGVALGSANCYTDTGDAHLTISLFTQ